MTKSMIQRKDDKNQTKFNRKSQQVLKQKNKEDKKNYSFLTLQKFIRNQKYITKGKNRVKTKNSIKKSRKVSNRSTPKRAQRKKSSKKGNQKKMRPKTARNHKISKQNKAFTIKSLLLFDNSNFTKTQRQKTAKRKKKFIKNNNNNMYFKTFDKTNPHYN